MATDIIGNQEAQMLQTAESVRREIEKISGIDDEEALAEALNCKEQILATRAECVSHEHRAAAKVFGEVIKTISKMVAAYEKRARS